MLHSTYRLCVKTHILYAVGILLFPAQLLGENMNMSHYTANGATGITYSDEQIITPRTFPEGQHECRLNCSNALENEHSFQEICELHHDLIKKIILIETNFNITYIEQRAFIWACDLQVGTFLYGMIYFYMHRGLNIIGGIFQSVDWNYLSFPKQPLEFGIG